MEFRTLKYLLSLSQLGSFTGAAKAHFVTQPAVSIQLRKLQEEMGVRLFEVEGRTVRFTRAGRVVLDFAGRFVELEQEMLREVADLEGLRTGSISLGTIDAASIYVLPGVFTRFRERYPGIDIRLEISSTRPLLDSLESGQLDLVVGTLPVDDTGAFEVYPVYREKLVVIAPPGHPLARKRSLCAGALTRYTFMSFHRGSVTRRIVEDGLRRLGVELRVNMTIDSPEAIKRLVSSGLGLAVLPWGTVHRDVAAGAVVVLKCRDLHLERRLGLMLRRDRYLSSTVRAFLSVLTEDLRIELPRRLSLEAGTTAADQA